MRIHCGGLLNSSLLSTYGDGAITSSFVEGLVFLHALHFVFAKHEIDFCSCERDNNRGDLKTHVVRTFANFELWVLHGHR